MSCNSDFRFSKKLKTRDRPLFRVKPYRSKTFAPVAGCPVPLRVATLCISAEVSLGPKSQMGDYFKLLFPTRLFRFKRGLNLLSFLDARVLTRFARSLALAKFKIAIPCLSRGISKNVLLIGAGLAVEEVFLPMCFFAFQCFLRLSSFSAQLRTL